MPIEGATMSPMAYPDIPYPEWKDTKTTLHLFSQIVGRVRLALAPKLNHWWHVTFYVSARGLTTSYMPHANGGLDIEFDFIDHLIVFRTTDGRIEQIPLAGHSVADMYDAVTSMLRHLGVAVSISEKPFDPSRVGSDIPFSNDSEHTSYDADAVHRFWQVLAGIQPIFAEFRGRYVGKCSPVHFFWHSFDLAVSRFSGRPATVSQAADPVTREAYSHEFSSGGFWVGDENIPEPAFYSYIHPEPKGLAEQPLHPAEAWWQPVGETHMALYRYSDFRNSDNPRQSLLDFLQSAYDAGTTLGEWPSA
ncbi:MAG: hypothetical protein GF341_09635 [candidate division Zixibacteria bacterium]|nr:hypothetical protein [candidate division Zixibacteria bacterium]